MAFCNILGGRDLIEQMAKRIHFPSDEKQFTEGEGRNDKMKQTRKGKRMLCVVFAAGLICLSGCADKETIQQKEESVSQETETSVRRETFNGIKWVKGSDGHMWTPPAGSYTDENGNVVDKDGCVIGSTGPLKFSPNAVG